METTSNGDAEQLLPFFSDRNFPALDFSPCNIDGKVSLRFCGEFPWNLELKSWILRN